MNALALSPDCRQLELPLGNVEVLAPQAKPAVRPDSIFFMQLVVAAAARQVRVFEHGLDTRSPSEVVVPFCALITAAASAMTVVEPQLAAPVLMIGHQPASPSEVA